MKFEKGLKLIVVSIVTVLSFAVAQAETVKAELLHDIQLEVQKCAVPVMQNNASKVPTVFGYKSNCQTLKVMALGSAQIFIDGEWYLAKISESKESDGGDLDDLFIFDSKGVLVAQRINVPAYDNVILAMGRSKK